MGVEKGPVCQDLTSTRTLGQGTMTEGDRAHQVQAGITSWRPRADAANRCVSFGLRMGSMFS